MFQQDNDLFLERQKIHNKARRSHMDSQRLKQRKLLQQGVHQHVLKMHLSNLNIAKMDELNSHLRVMESDNLQVSLREIDRVVNFVHQFKQAPLEFLTLLFSRINSESQNGLLRGGVKNSTHMVHFEKLIGCPERVRDIFIFISECKKPTRQLVADFFLQNTSKIIYSRHLEDFMGKELLMALVKLTGVRRITSEEDYYEQFLDSLKYLALNIERGENIELTVAVLMNIIKFSNIEIFDIFKDLNLVGLCLEKIEKTSKGQQTSLNRFLMGMCVGFISHPRITSERRQYIRSQYCQKILTHHMIITKNQETDPSTRQAIYDSFHTMILIQSFRPALTKHLILDWICSRIGAESESQDGCLEMVLSCLDKLVRMMNKKEQAFAKVVNAHSVAQDMLKISFIKRQNLNILILCLGILMEIFEIELFIFKCLQLPERKAYLQSILQSQKNKVVIQQVQDIIFIFAHPETKKEYEIYKQKNLI